MSKAYSNDDCRRMFTELEAVKGKLDNAVAFCNTYADHAAEIINIWRECFLNFKDSNKRLCLLYFIHELLCQQGMTGKKDYTIFYGTIIPNCISLMVGVNPHLDSKIVHIINKWVLYKMLDSDLLMQVIQQLPENVRKSERVIDNYYNQHLMKRTNSASSESYYAMNSYYNGMSESNEFPYQPLTITRTPPKNLPVPDYVSKLNAFSTEVQKNSEEDIFIKEKINKGNRVLSYIQSLNEDILQDQEKIDQEMREKSDGTKSTISYEEVSKSEMLSLLNSEILRLEKQQESQTHYLDFLNQMINTLTDELKEDDQKKEEAFNEMSAMNNIMNELNIEHEDLKRILDSGNSKLSRPGTLSPSRSINLSDSDSVSSANYYADSGHSEDEMDYSN